MIAKTNNVSFRESSDGCLEHISVSSMKNYLGCSLRYYFEKVLKLKTPVNLNLHLGKAVHAGLQYLNRAIWRDLDSSTKKVLLMYGAAFDELEKEDPVEYKKPGDKDKLIESGAALSYPWLHRSGKAR